MKKKTYHTILVSAFLTVCSLSNVNAQSGTLDLTFNSTGKKLTTSGSGEAFNEVAVQSDGKIVAVGSASDAAFENSFKVARFNTNGTLDATFGTGGIFKWKVGNECMAYDLAITTAGKIIVAGHSYVFVTGTPNMAVIQLTSAGVLDATFGTGGVKTIDVAGFEDEAYAMTLLSNGSILLAGESQDATGDRFPTIVKLTSAGALDATFGTGGIAKCPITLPDNNKFLDMAVQADGKIIGIGQIGNVQFAVNYAGLLARFNANGTLDNTYGTSGKVVKVINGIFDPFNAGKITSSGDLIVTGHTATADADLTAAYRMVIAKYNSSGQPVTTFGTSGMVTVNPIVAGDAKMAAGNQIVEQADGKLLIAGACNDVATGNQNTGVWRRNADGTADNTFGTSGVAQMDMSAGIAGRDEATGMVLQSDGKIVIVGGSYAGVSPNEKLNSVVARLNNTISVPPGLTLNLTAMIQGYCNGTTMTSDVVTVELHSGTSPNTIVTSKTGVTLSTAGAATVTFTTGSSGVNYYIVIKHRNSIETWSTLSMFTSGSLTYDFTSAQTKAYGSNMIKKGTKWCIYSGDVNQDGTVDLNDLTPIDNDAFNYVGGVNLATDVNGDQTIDLNDMTIVDNNAFNYISLMRP